MKLAKWHWHSIDNINLGGYPMSKKQIVGLVGSILLAVGVFLPILSVMMISINLFDANVVGKIVLGLGVISLALTLMKKYAGLWATGVISLGLVVFKLVQFQSEMSSAGPSDSSARDFEAALRGMVSTQWLGWIVLIVGSLAVIAAAAMKEQAASAHDGPQSFQRGA
jgi:hypothetical protein